jgi:ornithine cyclodeaminase
MREAEDTIRRGRLFVDTCEDMRRTGDISQPLDSGVLVESDIEGDLYELCSGSASGRTGADEITVFKNVGEAHLDVFTARYPLEVIEGR